MKKVVQVQVSIGTRGHMAKTKKQILEDLKLIDIIVEILDARLPVSSQNPDVREYSRNKKRIVVLNKADLADEAETKKWIEYYNKRSIPAVALNASTGKGINDVIEKIKDEYKDIEEKYIKKGRIGRTIKVMVLGIPNVGKSTFINRLANRSAAKVGNRPGVTTQKQWIRVNDEIELLDTPGMLWPRLDDEGVSMHLAFANSIGQNALDTEEVAFYLLKYLVLNYKNRVEKRYDVIIDLDLNADELDLNQQLVEIRDNIAIKKGAILSGGRINVQKVSDMIINDFREGKLGRITIEKASL